MEYHPVFLTASNIYEAKHIAIISWIVYLLVSIPPIKPQSIDFIEYLYFSLIIAADFFEYGFLEIVFFVTFHKKL